MLPCSQWNLTGASKDDCLFEAWMALAPAFGLLVGLGLMGVWCGTTSGFGGPKAQDLDIKNNLAFLKVLWPSVLPRGPIVVPFWDSLIEF